MSGRTPLPRAYTVSSFAPHFPAQSSYCSRIEQDTMGCTITFCTFWPWPRYAMLEAHKHHNVPHSLSESNFRNNEPEAEVRGAQAATWAVPGKYLSSHRSRLFRCSRASRGGRTAATPFRKAGWSCSATWREVGGGARLRLCCGRGCPSRLRF